MAAIRLHQSPSGRRVVIPEPEGDPEWDLVVESLADLPAPVAGEITLDFDASILWTVPCDGLDNRLLIPAGVVQRHQGKRQGCGFVSTSPISSVLVSGSNEVLFQLLTIDNNDPTNNGHGVIASSTDFQAVDCLSGAPNVCWLLGGSFQQLSRCVALGGNNGFINNGGAVLTNLLDCLGSSNGTGFYSDTAPADGMLRIVGGRFAGTAGRGIVLASEGVALVSGVEFDNMGISAINVSGMRSVTIADCIGASNIVALVERSATPPDGLSVSGCYANLAGSPWIGMDETTPGVVLRANRNASGFVAETALTP